jgi:hypothetical protein
VIRLLDRTSDGAATSFFQWTDTALDQIQADAVAGWPVRTGRSKAAFRRERRVTEIRLQNVLLNDARNRWGAYAYKIRWSVRTKASLDAEAARVAARGESPEAREAIRRYWRRRLTRRHGEGAPSEQLAGKQPWRELVRKPARKTTPTLVGWLRRDLYALASGRR